jgi:hypothetical protein
MNFIKPTQIDYIRIANNFHIENYIHNTKNKIDQNLPLLFSERKNNMQHKEIMAMKSLKKLKNIIIKPADKNLGVVIMNLDDYIYQCTTINY